jgi:hypothetical protein
MTLTTTTLTKTSAVAAAVGGLLFIAVQVKHPSLDVAFVTTTEWKVRETMKVLFGALSLVGITGMYLRQVKQIGVLGLLAYLLFSVGFLALMSVEVVGAVVLPSIAATSPGYVTDVLAVATGGHATGDVGLMQALNGVMAIGFLGGGLLFGIALLRANVLARWAAALLAVASVATAARAVAPQLNERLFAIPLGIALIGLGYSLWRDQRTPATRTAPSSVSSQLDPAGAR